MLQPFRIQRFTLLEFYSSSIILLFKHYYVDHLMWLFCFSCFLRFVAVVVIALSAVPKCCTMVVLLPGNDRAGRCSSIGDRGTAGRGLSSSADGFYARSRRTGYREVCSSVVLLYQVVLFFPLHVLPDFVGDPPDVIILADGMETSTD